MAKDKSKNDRIRNYALVITTFLVIVGAGWKVYGHFAKTTAVEAVAKTIVWVEERLHIGAFEDRVHRQEGNLERAKNRLRFKANNGPPTTTEKEDVKIQEHELQRAIKERDELVEQYKSKK